MCQATGRMRTKRATKGTSNMFFLCELLSKLPGKIWRQRGRQEGPRASPPPPPSEPPASLEAHPWRGDRSAGRTLTLVSTAPWSLYSAQFVLSLL